MTHMISDRHTVGKNFSCQNDIHREWQTYCQYKVQQSEWHSWTVTDILLVQILAVRMTFLNSDRLTVNILLISASIRSLVLGLRSFTTTRPEVFPSCVRNPTFSDIPQSFTMCMAIEVACWTNKDIHAELNAYTKNYDSFKEKLNDSFLNCTALTHSLPAI